MLPLAILDADGIALVAVDQPLSFVELLGRPLWHLDAACNEYPLSLFFSLRPETVEAAQDVCDGCLVLTECFRWAMAQGSHLECGGAVEAACQSCATAS